MNMPRPLWPSIISAGTHASSKKSSLFCRVLSPILASGFPTVKPAVPFSTRKQEMSPPKADFPSPFLANTITRPASGPLEMKTLPPDRE